MIMFTTGQVKYRTQIPPGTIQRYINIFADHFSEAARVPDKSRRYTEDDVQKLNIIRKMYKTHAPEYEIRAALTGVIETHALPITEYENLVAIAEAARLAMIEAEKSAQRANESNLAVESKIKYHDDHFFEIRKMLRKLDDTITAIENNLKVVNRFMNSDAGINVQEEIKKMQQQEVTQFQNTPNPEKKKSIILEFLESWKYF